jgi:hypothetical protein
MNERIKELLKKATRRVDPDDREWVFSEVDQKKFAELIVRECMFAVENHGGMCGVTSSKKIKEHFGVKE